MRVLERCVSGGGGEGGGIEIGGGVVDEAVAWIYQNEKAW
jgi:hypothetical protein